MPNNTTKNGKFKALLLFLLLFSLKISAQCPTIPTSPITICDASGFTFNNLNASATDVGNGISWYDAATGGNLQAPNSLVQEGTYYAGDTSGTCGTRDPLTVNFTISPTNANLSYVKCTNDNKTGQDYFDEIVSPATPGGLTATIYSDEDLTTPLDLTQLLTNGGTNLYIVFSDGTCESQVEIGSIGIFPSPQDPTPPTPQQFCSDTNPTVGDLNTGTASNASWYTTSDASGSPLPTNQALVNAIYYVRAETFFCDSNTVPVTVEINDPVNAGTSARLDYCENVDVPTTDFNLFDSLGVADTNGTWSGPFTTTNGHLGTINITGQTTGNYEMTYTVPAINACPEETATVTIVIHETFTSGTANTPAVFCEADAPNNFDLFSLLDNEDVGGQWTQGNTSSGPVTTSPLDLTTLTPGTYNYTYTQNVAPNPCPEEFTTVQIEILADPNPGTAINAEFCENDLTPNPFDLFTALDGSQDNNTGTWTDASNNTVTNPIDISGLTVAGSPYTFTYTINNGTCEDSEAITLTVLPAPESGTVNADSPISFCLGEAPSNYDLFDLLDGEDQTGTWFEGVDNTGTTTTNPIDLSLLTPGNYSFTFDVDAVGTCDDELVTVEVIINDLPNTGVANNPAPFCESDPALNNTAFDLNDILTGEDAGGNWTDDDMSGVLTGNTIDLSSLPVGTFNYTYDITDTNNCSNSTTVTITILEAPESGTVSADSPIAFCLGDAQSNYDLFDLLDGEDQTGTWFEGVDNTGTATTNPIDLSVLTAGNYSFTFDVDAIGTCDDDLVTVEVIINDLPNTGVANNPAPFCANDPALNNTTFNLNDVLTGEDAGGNWTDDNMSGVLTGNSIDLSALPVGTFNYTYDITDSNTCANSTTVTITILEAPESGTVSANSPIEFCIGSAPNSFDLFDLLDGEDQTGTWFEGVGNTGTATTNSIDLSVLTAGNYSFTFDVDAIGTCDDELVIVEVIINNLPNTGTAIPLTICETTTNTALDLFGQLAGNDSRGTWSDDNTTGTLTGNTVDLTALPVGTSNFTYTINDSNTCTDSTTVSITVEEAPDAGTATDFSICLIDTTTTATLDLFNQLAGNDTGGTWSDDNTSGALTGNTVDLTSLTVNTMFNFTYTVNGTGTCTDDTETVSVIVNETTAPSAATTQEFCDRATVANLAATGNNIQWYDNATLGTALATTTALVTGETYYASQTDATSNCESSVRTEVTVTIFTTPNAGTAQNQTLCNNVTFNLNDALTGEDAGGTWTDDNTSGALTGNMIDTNGLAVGSYNFTYTVLANAPCFNTTETVTITIEEPVTAGTGTDISLCSVDASINLFNQLAGETAGGSWTLNGAAVSNTINPSTDVSGTYIYTVVSACNFSTESVEITIQQAANAGSDNTVTFCESDGTVDLLTQLMGTPDTTGTWSPALTSGTNIFDPSQDGTGTYTYTVLATAPCTTDATATLTITANTTPAPTTTNNNVTLCVVNNPTVADLNAFVTGNNIEWFDTLTATTALALTDALIDGEDYYATQTDATTSCPSSLRTQINVTVGDAPTPTLITGGNTFCINDNPTIETVTNNIVELNTSTNNVVWYDAPANGSNYTATDILVDGQTYYAVLIDPVTNCESSIRLDVTVDLSACGNITIPDGFSPNGDGVNDTFTLDNLEFLYPNYEIEFYNRYGSLIYKTKAGQPEFAGKSNQSGLINKGDLPVGVYYYILNFNDGVTKTKQGSFYLNR